MRHALIASLVFLVASTSFALGADRPFGIESRTPWTTSKLVGSPEPAPPFRLVRVLPRITFDKPVHVIVEPGRDRLLVVQYLRDIVEVTKSPDSTRKDVFLARGGRDFYGLTFHPKFADNRFVYVFSNDASAKTPKDRITRYQVLKGKEFWKCDVSTAKIIIEWESNGHNGGDLAFGPDGFLYISAGDGTSSSDPDDTGQDLSDLRSAVIRIDVDHPDKEKGYAVPKDNPFVNLVGARPEIWAYGFRNPWRFCFEPGAGRLWMGDIGQDTWEMIELVEKGSNHGWSVNEGSHPFQPLKPKRGPTPIKPPLIEHHHAEARSITGGGFYTKEKFPELKGAYLYGDFATGRIWAVRYDGQKITWHKEIADSSVAFLGFAFDEAGDVYLTDFNSGEMFRLERSVGESYSAEFPRFLSDTGLFSSTAELRAAPGLVPYSVNSPLWSDGASKDRLLAVPDTAKIEFNKADGAWGFPDGSALVKTFALPVVERGSSKLRRVETRVFTKLQNEWVGYSYLWNDDQTDAVLVGKGGLDRVYAVADDRAVNGVRSQTWRYPSRAECMVCHSRAAGFVLGLNTPQMNRGQDYQGINDNQLRALGHAGYFNVTLDRPVEKYPKLANPGDPSASLEDRARSYLHVNCAICHVESGGGNSRMQLRYTLKPEELSLIDAKPQHESFGTPEARLVAPGHPNRSVLLQRVKILGPGRMPPLASSVVDAQAVDLLRAWILQVPPVKPEKPSPAK